MSSHERLPFLYHAFTHLEIEENTGRGWKEDYKKVIHRYVDVCGTVRGEVGFSEVYDYHGVDYEQNALGAFMFSRNALVHVNDYISEALEKKNVVYT